jgi:hypothetical protein
MKIDKAFKQMNAIEMYFSYLDEEYFVRALESFSKGLGYCVDYFVTSGYSFEYEAHEEGYFGESGIKFEIEPPASDVHQLQIVDYNNFHLFLSEMADQYKESHSSEQEKIDQLLKVIKIKLNI